MPLYPLWSGCLLEYEKTRDSNAPVEGWMSVVKRDILVGEKRLRTGRFVHKMRLKVAGRLRKVRRNLKRLEVQSKTPRKRNQDDVNEEKKRKGPKISKGKQISDENNYKERGEGRTTKSDEYKDQKKYKEDTRRQDGAKKESKKTTPS